MPSRERTHAVDRGAVDVQAIRRHFVFPGVGRVVTNNAASTQPPGELLELYRSLAAGYENVHRGQSDASRAMTALFEESYDTIARFLGAPGRASIALYRNTTEAINAVMYSLLTEFRDGDNVVTTMMEHNSNYVPWYAMCREILPRLGRRVEHPGRGRSGGSCGGRHQRLAALHPAERQPQARQRDREHRQPGEPFGYPKAARRRGEQARHPADQQPG